ncbi:MAG: Ig-like domain-containing protein [Myxococcales bacterium]|jgi:hypothetical protein
MTRPSLGIALVGALLASGCKAKPTTLQVEPSSLKFTAEGETVMLLASVLDESGKPLEHKPCIFVSSNSAVAEAKQDGTIASVGAGATEIRVSCEGLSAQVPVQVRLPTTIKLDLGCDKRCNLQSTEPISFKLEGLGATAKLSATVLDNEGEPVVTKVSYEVRDPDYHSGVRNLGIEVSDEGKVSARGVGKFMILAHAGGAVAKANAEVALPVVDVVKVDRASVWLKPGEKASVAASTFQRSIHGLRKVEGARLSWQSGNASVAIVDDEGLITAVGEGFADVVVAADSGAFAQVGVRVAQKDKPDFTLKKPSKKVKKANKLKPALRPKLRK